MAKKIELSDIYSQEVLDTWAEWKEIRAKIEVEPAVGSWRKFGELHDITPNAESSPIRPQHYKAGPGDVIDFCERHELNFARGNVVKYLVRAGRKNPATEVEDLKKALEYLKREIEYRESQ